jgi:hypothetical protein
MRVSHASKVSETLLSSTRPLRYWPTISATSFFLTPGIGMTRLEGRRLVPAELVRERPS